MEIKVGIKTAGSPILRKEGDVTVLENMLIGDGFHWEKTIKASLSGKIELLISPDGDCKEKSIEPDVEENRFVGSDDNVSLINILPVETYLECVVGSEMNPAAPIEFLKAHAVISRSWVMGKILDLHPCDSEGQVNTDDYLIGWDDTGSHRSFHVCSDDHCQRYQGLQNVDPTSLRAIRDTADEVLVSENGHIIDARFSKCCGGVTELFSTCWQPVEPDCIKSVIDPWCNLSGFSLQSRSLLLSSVLKDYDLSTQGYGLGYRLRSLNVGLFFARL